MTGQIRAGDIVRYARGWYEVAFVQGDLLVPRGVADLETRTCREGCAVLASDVELIGEQARMFGGRS